MAFSHWEYFQAIEKDFVAHTRSIGYASNYYSVRSRDLGKIILASGSGLETTLNLTCRSIAPGESPASIAAYYQIVTAKYPGITKCRILLPSYNMALTPWQEWTEGHAPKWWEGYLALREDLEAGFREANYWNALYATAGLLCAILYYNREIHGRSYGIDPDLAPRVFQPKRYVKKTGLVPGWSYSLPEDVNG